MYVEQRSQRALRRSSRANAAFTRAAAHSQAQENTNSEGAEQEQIKETTTTGLSRVSQLYGAPILIAPILIAPHSHERAATVVSRRTLEGGGSSHAANSSAWRRRQNGKQGRENPVVRNNYAVPAMMGGWDDDGQTRIGKHGLTGFGEVIAMADTGVDWDNCFFADAAHPNAGANHRKIPFYRRMRNQDGWARWGDAVNGHGTHVAGAIAGHVLGAGRDEGDVDMLRKYDGIAPMAKLSIDDVSDDRSANLVFPDSLSEGLWPFSYDNGARVHSNSWGYDSPEYTIDAREADEFTYDHDDFLIIVAAGNAGPNPSTVGSPATAKNIIAVGASENHPFSYPVGGTVVVQIDQGGTAGFNGQQFEALAAAFGALLQRGAPFIAVKIVGMVPALGCAAPSNSAEMRGNVALIQRGECFFKEKVLHAQEAGATAVIVTNIPGQDGQDRSALVMADSYSIPQSITIPSMCVGSKVGGVLWGQILENVDVLVTFPVVFLSSPPSLDNLAYFSSQGPTGDQRFKPDIIAPGESITSAKSDGDLSSFQCSTDAFADSYALTTMDGTSMATPLVAGAFIPPAKIQQEHPHACTHAAHSHTRTLVYVYILLYVYCVVFPCSQKTYPCECSTGLIKKQCNSRQINCNSRKTNCSSRKTSCSSCR